MRAPRPTLLIHNAVDSCCFRAPSVKPYIYENVKPFFQLFGRTDALQWHENFNPGTHNYQLDNREQAYRFFSREFGCQFLRKRSSATMRSGHRGISPSNYPPTISQYSHWPGRLPNTSRESQSPIRGTNARIGRNGSGRGCDQWCDTTRYRPCRRSGSRTAWDLTSIFSPTDSDFERPERYRHLVSRTPPEPAS